MDINDLNQMEENENQDSFLITEDIKLKLESAAKWTKFIAIVSFIMLGLFVVAGFGIGSIFSSFGSQMDGISDIPMNSSGFGWAMGFIYLVFALIYFFPILYLFNFSKKTLKALEAEDSNYLFSAFSNLNTHYKYMSILIIIGLVFYVIALLGVGIGSMMG